MEKLTSHFEVIEAAAKMSPGHQTFVFAGGYCLYTFHQQVVRLAKRRPDVEFTFEWTIHPAGDVRASTVTITCAPKPLPGSLGMPDARESCVFFELIVRLPEPDISQTVDHMPKS